MVKVCVQGISQGNTKQKEKIKRKKILTSNDQELTSDSDGKNLLKREVKVK